LRRVIFVGQPHLGAGLYQQRVTVSGVRDELESTGQIDQLDKTVGAVRAALQSTAEIPQFRTSYIDDTPEGEGCPGRPSRPPEREAIRPDRLTPV